VRPGRPLFALPSEVVDETMASHFRSCLILALSATATVAAQPTRSLPDETAFLQTVRTNLQRDRALQSRYTYREKRIDIQRDGTGAETGRTEKVLEIERNRDEQLRTETAAQREKRLREEADDIRKENALIDDAFQLYRFELIGREMLDGHEAIVVMFAPAPGAKPRTDEGKVLLKFSGRAWIAERDHQLMRVEVESMDDVTFGMGLLARIHKGSQMVFQRRPLRTDASVWLPFELRYSGGGRLLLVKKMRVDRIREYSDYKAVDRR
jgi:hypothetical protein